MKSNYKRLGNYIEPCNEKNVENVIKELRGISNRKYFQKAKTNTIGIDLSKYRVVRTGQFAFNRATTRNGEKISIALRKGEDCIVSPSYRIFKSKDENILNSEYLMMWFRRPEFDRYARYKSHGSAHEFFDWEEMCEVELPIPSIEKQRAIVKEYNTVVNRIKLNEELNQKLEETAQAIYKEWFVDFEFPIDKDLALKMGNAELEGKPFKSSGGEMVWNEELDKEVPEGWEVKLLSDFIEIKYGKDYKKLSEGKYPLYGSGGIMKYVNDYLHDKPSILIPRKGTLTNIIYIDKPFWSVDTMFYSIIKREHYGFYTYHFLNGLDFYALNVGSAVPSMTTKMLNEMKLILPSYCVLKEFNDLSIILNNRLKHSENERKTLNNFQAIFYARMSLQN
ncbi:MAG TPA: restriction endonuclease subunit S [Brumimicrobium sp.]|nr:restriction endonuclease subunit S [Brumimicrobium sp.]